MTGFQALSYSEEKVGKHIKASKKKHSWHASIDNHDLKVELFISKISRKIKLFINKDLVYHGKLAKSNLLQFNQEYFGHQVHVLQQGKIFDLRVDSVSFEYIYLQNKNKEEFKFEFSSKELKVPDSVEVNEVKVEDKKQVKAYNPFDELFDNEDEKKEEVKEKKPQKLKPFAIKPPQQVNHGTNQIANVGFGIFQAPDLKPVKADLDGNLFENPSKPVEKTQMLSFPAADNPFLTGNFQNKGNSAASGQFYTGTYHK